MRGDQLGLWSPLWVSSNKQQVVAVTGAGRDAVAGGHDAAGPALALMAAGALRSWNNCGRFLRRESQHMPRPQSPGRAQALAAACAARGLDAALSPRPAMTGYAGRWRRRRNTCHVNTSRQCPALAPSKRSRPQQNSTEGQEDIFSGPPSAAMKLAARASEAASRAPSPPCPEHAAYAQTAEPQRTACPGLRAQLTTTTTTAAPSDLPVPPCHRTPPVPPPHASSPSSFPDLFLRPPRRRRRRILAVRSLKHPLQHPPTAVPASPTSLPSHGPTSRRLQAVNTCHSRYHMLCAPAACRPWPR